eukprot:gene11335-23722_t
MSPSTSIRSNIRDNKSRTSGVFNTASPNNRSFKNDTDIATGYIRDDAAAHANGGVTSGSNISISLLSKSFTQSTKIFNVEENHDNDNDKNYNDNNKNNNNEQYYNYDDINNNISSKITRKMTKNAITTTTTNTDANITREFNKTGLIYDEKYNETIVDKNNTISITSAIEQQIYSKYHPSTLIRQAIGDITSISLTKPQ